MEAITGTQQRIPTLRARITLVHAELRDVTIGLIRPHHHLAKRCHGDSSKPVHVTQATSCLPQLAQPMANAMDAGAEKQQYQSIIISPQERTGL